MLVEKVAVPHMIILPKVFWHYADHCKSLYLSDHTLTFLYNFTITLKNYEIDIILSNFAPVSNSTVHRELLTK